MAPPAPAQAVADETSDDDDDDDADVSLEEGPTDNAGGGPERLRDLQDIVGRRSLIAHGVRGTIHIVDDAATFKTACGQRYDRWAAHCGMTLAELGVSFWALCDRPACFQRAAMNSEARAASRQRSGRPY